MHSIKDRIGNKDPDILQGFASRDTDILADQFGISPTEFVVKEIHCGCGSELHYLEVLQSKELKGVCSKSEFIEYRPPAYTVCSACKKSKLLFDPVIHGWNGESGRVKDDENLQKLSRFSLNPGRIYVAYSYSNVDEYDKLLNDGVDNIENYFDSFAVWFAQSKTSAILKVFTVKCR